MSGLNDLERGGYDPLQDHDQGQELQGRRVRYAVRVEKTIKTDQPGAGHVILEGHTPDFAAGTPRASASAEKSAGDIHGGFFVQREGDERPMGMWFYSAAPAVTSEPSRDLRGEPGEQGLTQERPRQAETQSGERADVADQRVKVRLVADPAYAEDTRLREIDASLAGIMSPLPKGYPGTLLVTTNERRQEELFLPAGAGPLIAVDFAGDPATATLVADERADASIDPARKARLHTFMRVVRLGAGCAAGGNNALAWQLKAATQDGHFGGGLVIDFGSAVAELEGTTDPDETPPDRPAGEGITNEETTFQIGAVINLAEAQTPEPREGQVGGVRFLNGQTRERGDDSGDPTVTRLNRPPSATAGLVCAYASSKLSGPLDVGLPDDVHRIGTTLDGEPVNSLHLATSALWLGGPGDGPLDFEMQSMPITSPWPFKAPVHLRWDGFVGHEWVCGARQGRWRWFAEVPLYIPEDDEERNGLPPPEEKDPVGFIPDFSRLKPGNPAHRNHGRIPQWAVELAKRLGLRVGSIGAAGVVDLSPEQELEMRRLGLLDEEGNLIDGGPNGGQPEWRPDEGGDHPRVRARYPTMLQALRLGGGTYFRAYPWADAAPNVTGSDGLEQVPVKTRKELDLSPNVALLTPYGRGSGTVDGWDHSVVGGGAGDSHSPGGVMFLPSRARGKDILEENTPDVDPAYLVFPLGMGCLGFAKPHTGTGGIASGVAIRTSPFNTGIEFVNFGADGEELIPPSAPRLRFGEGGLILTDGDMVVGGKLTVTDVIDPTGLGITSLAARPFGLTVFGSGLWQDTETVERLRFFESTLAQDLEVAFADPGVAEGRLSVSTDPVPDPTTIGPSLTLRYVPYAGDRIALWDGTQWRMEAIPAGLLIAVGGLAGVPAVGSVYDIFAQRVAGGGMILTSVIWATFGAGTSTRATALARQDGAFVLSGDATQRYLGTIRIGTGVRFEDSALHAGVWNVQNRVRRTLRSADSTASWVDNTKNAWAAANGGNAQWKHDYVIGLDQTTLAAGGEQTDFSAHARIAIERTSIAGFAWWGVGFNSTTGAPAGSLNAALGNAPATPRQPMDAGFRTHTVAEGYNFVQAISGSSSTGAPVYTSTYFTNDGGAFPSVGMVSTVLR